MSAVEVVAAMVAAGVVIAGALVLVVLSVRSGR